MRLCHGRRDAGEFIGVSWGDRWLDLTQAMQSSPDQFPWLRARPFPTIRDLLENEPDLAHTLTAYLEQLQAAGEADAYWIATEPRLFAPIANPSKIIAVGRNYVAHAQESNLPVPGEPIIFAKAPSSVVGPDDNIIYPPGVTRLDPELELAVVIGRRAKAVPEQDALGFVAGYTILNDVTARDMQERDVEARNPWFRSKSMDTFCPLGPHLVLKDEIADPHRLELTLRVNGQVRQHSSTEKMIFRIPHLIAFISRHMTLEPGDVIATGTPEGIAPIQRQDWIEGSIAGLGTLRNRVI